MNLDKEYINEQTKERLKKYNDLNFFSKFSMYMGLAQILEFGLKKLLEKNFEYSLNKMERCTLGQVKDELIKNNLRADFILLLESIVKDRNYIAHSMLLDSAILKSLINYPLTNMQYLKEERQLDKAIYELEQLIFLFDWTNENNGW